MLHYTSSCTFWNTQAAGRGHVSTVSECVSVCECSTCMMENDAGLFSIQVPGRHFTCILALLFGNSRRIKKKERKRSRVLKGTFKSEEKSRCVTCEQMKRHRAATHVGWRSRSEPPPDSGAPPGTGQTGRSAQTQRERSGRSLRDEEDTRTGLKSAIINTHSNQQTGPTTSHKNNHF